VGKERCCAKYKKREVVGEKMLQESDRKLIKKLYEVGTTNIHKLGIKCRMAYNTAFRRSKKLIDKGIFVYEKVGRQGFIVLSDKGKKLAESLLKVEEILNELEL